MAKKKDKLEANERTKEIAKDLADKSSSQRRISTAESLCEFLQEGKKKQKDRKARYKFYRKFQKKT